MNAKKLITAWAAFALAAFSAGAADITFSKVVGKVEFLDGTEWIQAVEGDVVEQGTVISTGYKSKAVLKSDSATFEIGAMTRITLEDFSKSNGKQSTQLFLDSGTIQSNVVSGNRFKVRSAVATASVRGTSFKTTASGRLNVTDGLVAFGPAESSRASSSKSSESKKASEIPAATSKSTAFTSTEDVGGVKAVPVFAGQSSVANAATGKASSPQSEKAKNSGASNSTASSLSAIEAVSSSQEKPAKPFAGESNKPRQTASLLVDAIISR